MNLKSILSIIESGEKIVVVDGVEVYEFYNNSADEFSDFAIQHNVISMYGELVPISIRYSHYFRALVIQIKG